MTVFRRHALLSIGWMALALGLLGIVLPLLPTTPFVLLAAACFARSSHRLHGWLVEHPLFGEHIRDYLNGQGLRRRTKILAVATLWASVTISSVVFVPVVAADVLLLTAAAGVTLYLLRLPTRESAG